MKNVILHPHALSELREASFHYAEVSLRLAGSFIDKVDENIEAIKRNPLGFPMFENEIRKCVMLRFPFTIFYEDLNTVLYIWAVAHQSCHPDYWKGRLKDIPE